MTRSATPIVEDDTKHSTFPLPQTPSEHDRAVKDMFVNAASATDKEHKMTLREGLRLYPKAIGWSALISTLCAMEGYDVSLIGNFCMSTVFSPSVLFTASPEWLVVYLLVELRETNRGRRF